MSDNSAVYNLLISAEFQKINNIRKKLYWSSFFMSGFDIYNPAPGYMSNGDPRGTTGFAEFAVKNIIPLYYLYPKLNNEGDYEINFTNLPYAAQKINENLIDYNKNIDIEQNTKIELLCLISGALYFNKYNSSDTTNCTYKTKNNQIEKLNICTGLSDRVTHPEDLQSFINDNLQKINDYIAIMTKFNNGTSSEEFTDARGYIISSSLSHASKDLIQQYYETQDEYNKLINSIYKAAESTTSLTLCINNAFIGSFESSGEEPSYIDIDQVNYCGNGAKANQKQDENIKTINNEIIFIKQRLNTIILILQIIILMLISIFVYKFYIIRKYNEY